MIRYSLRGSKAGRHWETLVGYTFLALMCHLESLFQPGMTWENYGEWQVDHIRPIASFTFTSADDPEFRQCWALSNLQPLWATDNHHKGARWTKELTA
jgi:5-methylcytosine-specific restriction endonuclease McrA